MAATASLRNYTTDRILGPPPVERASIGGVETVECFSFELSDVKVFHQTEVNSLNLVVSYQYMPNLRVYPDFRLLVSDIMELLNRYPRPGDYWEKVNTAIVRMVLERYLMLASIRSTMHIAPTALDPYSRETTVEMRRLAGEL